MLADDRDERHPLAQPFDAEHRHHGPVHWHEWLRAVLLTVLHMAIVGVGLFFLLDG